MILYTTNCPKCKVLETKLNSKNITYDICDDVSVMEEKGFMEAPKLEVDDKVLNFKEAVDYINTL